MAQIPRIGACMRLKVFKIRTALPNGNMVYDLRFGDIFAKTYRRGFFHDTPPAYGLWAIFPVGCNQPYFITFVEKGSPDESPKSLFPFSFRSCPSVTGESGPTTGRSIARSLTLRLPAISSASANRRTQSYSTQPAGR